jgi:DNA-binding transcriptional ArsR family regulator
VSTYRNGRSRDGGGGASPGGGGASPGGGGASPGGNREGGRPAKGAAPGPPGAPRTNGFAALGDPTRRAIFERLGDGPSAVGELANEFPVSRPAVSQHLKVLKEAGLVTNEADGNRRVYRVDPRGVEQMRAYFDTFWSDALAAFKKAAERKGAT